MSAGSFTLTEIDEAAATILDTESAETISSIDQPEQEQAAPPPEESFMDFWRRRVHRSCVVFDGLELEPRITTNFGPTHAALDFDGQLEHAKYAIMQILDQGYIKKFEIGITFLPNIRFDNPTHGYSGLGYHSMQLLCCHEDPDFIAGIEIKLLETFRRLDRRGYLVNPNGHCLCANRAPGGESRSHGFAPYFCYIVIQYNPRAQSQGMLLTRADSDQ